MMEEIYIKFKDGRIMGDICGYGNPSDVSAAFKQIAHFIDTAPPEELTNINYIDFDEGKIFCG